MPLAKPLPALKSDLRSILLEDLPAALTALRDLLPEGTDKHRQALALGARLKDANKARAFNTIAPDEYQRRIDTVRADCLLLIDGLEDADFEPPAAETPQGGPAPKEGSLLYRVPHEMEVAKPSICTIRIALDAEALLEDIVLDDDVHLRHRVEVSDMMKAELLDPEGAVFDIVPLSAGEQLVRERGYTQWLFSARPRVAGVHQLLVKVSMMEYVANLGRYVPREVSVLETVTIVTQSAAPADADEAPFKATGERFAVGPEGEAPGRSLTRGDLEGAPMKGPGAVQPPPPPPPATAPQQSAPAETSVLPRKNTRSVRAMALFLVFLLAGTSAATWAATPPHVREYWLDVRLQPSAEHSAGYVKKYASNPKAQEYVEKTIQRYALDYPAGEHFDEIAQAAEARPELLPALETALLTSVQQQATEQNAKAVLTYFPTAQNIETVAEISRRQPALQTQLQPKVKEAILHQFKMAHSSAEAAPLVPLLKKAGSPSLTRTVENIAMQRGWEPLLPQIREAAQVVEQQQEAPPTTQNPPSETQTAAPDTDGDGTPDNADGCPTDKNKTTPGACGCGTPDTDTDGDGVPDCKDACPAEKGDASGCPPPPSSRPKRSGLEMVPVPGGTFTMGCREGRDKNCENSEKPAHEVTLSDFQIGKYEVTQADWRDVMGSDPPELYNKGCDECPVEYVSWEDVQVFIKKLNARTGKKYRLPTEAEWEYAARGGRRSKDYQYAGSNDPDKVAWYDSNYKTGNTFGARKTTRPVGGKVPNELGLYDMSGNVWEWCSDWYDSGYYGNSPSSNPAGPTFDSYRVLRGGSWGNFPQGCRVAARGYDTPGIRLNYIGFRLAFVP